MLDNPITLCIGKSHKKKLDRIPSLTILSKFTLRKVKENVELFVVYVKNDVLIS